MRPGDAVYLSLTVYGGPSDGHYSERIVGSLNSREAPVGPDGTITMVLSADDPGDGTPWIRLEEDAVAIITRDYLADPVHDTRAAWSIEADDAPATYREDDASLARRFRGALTWIRDQSAMVPLPEGEPNSIDPPYPVIDRIGDIEIPVDVRCHCLRIIQSRVLGWPAIASETA